MKILVLPDAHLKVPLLQKIDQLLEGHPDWECVSLGDWCDDWGRPPKDYEGFFRAFEELCCRYQNRIHLCWGNHDYGYWSCPEKHAGYIRDAEEIVRFHLKALDLISPIQVVHRFDTLLFSHAGISKEWVANYKNEVDMYPDLSLIEYTNTRHADLLWGNGSPLWRRPTFNLGDTFNSFFLQVVGHTPVSTITLEPKSRVLYTDTWSTDSDRNPLGDQSLVAVDSITQEWEVINAV